MWKNWKINCEKIVNNLIKLLLPLAPGSPSMTCGLDPGSHLTGVIMGEFSSMVPINCGQLNLGAWFLDEIMTMTKLIVVDDLPPSLMFPPFSDATIGSRNGFPVPRFLINELIGDFNHTSPENGFVMKNGENCDSVTQQLVNLVWIF